MRLPQFSLKALAGIVALAAVACCSLIYASSIWSAILYTAAIALLAFATLAAIYCRERARAYWLGCAFCGWLYLLLVFGPFSDTRQMTTPGQLNVDSELATTHLARWCYASVLPKLRTPPPPVAQTVKLKFTTTAGTVSEVKLNELVLADLDRRDLCAQSEHARPPRGQAVLPGRDQLRPREPCPMDVVVRPGRRDRGKLAVREASNEAAWNRVTALPEAREPSILAVGPTGHRGRRRDFLDAVDIRLGFLVGVELVNKLTAGIDNHRPRYALDAVLLGK